MMASVKYQFGVLRTTKSKNKQCPNAHQDNSMHFSLDDDEEQSYSTVLNGYSNADGAAGQSSRLLRTNRSGLNQDEREDGSAEGMRGTKKNGGAQMASKGTAKQTTQWNAAGAAGMVKNGLAELGRSRGPARMRTSVSKSSSLLTDEFELDDVLEEEEDELDRHSMGSDDDEDDLLRRTFTQQNNGGGGGYGDGGGLLNGGAVDSSGNGGGAGVSSNSAGSWRHRLRRRINTLTLCCFPLVRTGGGGAGARGFTQFR